MPRPTYPLRYLSTKSPLSRALDGLPNFGPRGNLTGMRQNFGWQDAMPVKCGVYIYDCRSRPDIYERASTR